jgi:hypothetical protein
MTQGTDSATAGERPSAYERLGVSPDSSFDEVQAAKSARLAELGDDPQARAQIEAAYDAVLMDRLKERQQGKVSSAALNASQREAVRPVASPPPPPLSRPSLPSLPSLPRPSLSVPQLSLPVLALAEGRERWFPLVADGLVLLLLLFLPGPSAELLLALATGVTVVTLQWRHRRFLAAVAWSFGLLTAGLLLGGLLQGLLDPSLPMGLPLSVQQVQALPALVLLLLGALLIG